MESHSNRPEVRSALETGVGWDMHYSTTLHTRMLYVATRIGSREHPIGVARISENLSDIDLAVGRIHHVFFIAALIAFIVAALAGARIAGGIAGPIHAMRSVARDLAKGDLDRRVRVADGSAQEISDLADTLNVMASELRARMIELTGEKTKLQAILDKADDGLMVVDHEARVQMANPAAVSLIGTDPDQVRGRTIIESTLSHDLSELVERVLRTKAPASLGIQLSNPRQTYLNVYVTPLELGAVVVMHDLTEASRTDALRRDFVANVSHELRNPLASIRPRRRRASNLSQPSRRACA
jgi:two-component system phosphate regulon sensor histidine kinase PhoR